MCRPCASVAARQNPDSPDTLRCALPAFGGYCPCHPPTRQMRTRPHSRVGKQRLMPLGHRFLQSSLGTGLAPLDASGSPSILLQSLALAPMVDSVVTWFTNDQRFTPFRNHALLPPFLPIEIFDFPYMVQLKQFSLRCTAQLTNFGFQPCFKGIAIMVVHHEDVIDCIVTG